MRSKRGGRIEAEICLYKEVTLQRILTEEETKECWGLRFLVEQCSRRSDQRVRSVYASSSICVQTGLKAAALLVPILECRGEDRRPPNARPYDRAVFFFRWMESFSNSMKGGTIGGVQKAECFSVANWTVCQPSKYRNRDNLQKDELSQVIIFCALYPEVRRFQKAIPQWLID